MDTYRIELHGDLLIVGFAEPAQNDVIVRDAADRLRELKGNGELKGGSLLKINGAASLPVAFVLAYRVSHLYGAIAVYDPKLRKYVICITHNPAFNLGDLID